MNSTPVQSLSGHLLIAMPSLQDANFSKTVTYICEHNDKGALGIVINRPLDIELADVLKQMELQISDPDVASLPVFLGGPVQEQRGFVLHTPLQAWDSTLAVGEHIGLTTSRDILVDMSQGRGPGQSLVALGYAGWGAGQLEHELMQNAWLHGPADNAILFELPAEQRWQAAADKLGIDINLLTANAGHA